ncbi:hypothetical protein QSJ18_04595 [Gordonia sp. ABSL1-1]|uniref:hypothetical protein n=1 Tax=Gordonia sp. ABSL1-1 TaxID=3053923 RepID=UPI002572D5F2|nr:hypothetical protein [Gordonia sp. ABSL1-1]MDL9936014.1 hypothetical protein [Gordonia sp. ABSL1-1]
MSSKTDKQRGARRTGPARKVAGKAGAPAPTTTNDTSTDREVLTWRVLSVVAVLAVVAAVVCAGVFGYHAYQAYFVDKPTAQARDEATDAAEQAMVNVTTIDPAKLEDWNRNLNASFTGDALKQVQQQIQTSLVEPLRKSNGQPGRTVGFPRTAAATEVNADDGTAKVLVYVAVVGVVDGKKSDPATMGFLLTMLRGDGDVWKASQVVPLDAIEFTDTGQGANPQPQTPAQTPQPQGGGN